MLDHELFRILSAFSFVPAAARVDRNFQNKKLYVFCSCISPPVS